MSNLFDVNILVNGSRCKQYQHDGKVFIQANPGSEYVIEIKNNYYKRIEAVSAVDGLNVLNGKTASEKDTGYIIDGYHSEKIKGFRFSDDEWALFKFGYKFMGNTYAQSKEDGSEKNCGVIGVRLYYEYELITYTVTSAWLNPPQQPIYWHSPNPQWISGGCYTSDVQYGWSLPSDSNIGNITAKSTSEGAMNTACNCSSGILRGVSGGKPKMDFCCGDDSQLQNSVTAQNFKPNFVGQEPKGFDMGTEWGKREKSKVTSVLFSRGYLAHTLDIYYASRESLIEMGVPVTNQLKVNLPQSFPNKYATPPSGWVG